MTTETGKTRLQKALAHRNGTVPIDLGGTPVTGIHVSILSDLRRHFGLPDEPIKVIDPCQMLGLPENDLLDILEIDIAGIFSPMTKFGFENKDWKEWRTPWNQTVLVGEGFQVDERPDGVYVYPGGDRSVSPSAFMPTGGWFFDSIIRQEPFDPDRWNIEDNLEEFVPISDPVLRSLKEQLENAKPTGRGIVAGIGGTAFGDVSNIPGPFLKHPKGLRDIARWYMAMAMSPDHIREMFSRQLEIVLANLAKAFAILGDEIDVIYLCGTDFGTQTSTFCSPKTFRELWFPYYKEMNDWIHAHTTWKTFKHSCGAVADFLPLLIECGFDIINPVQCSAKGMDPQFIKDTYGDRIVFWGGGIDTQHVLPFGTPQEVRDQVLSRCEIFSKNGGYVFNTIHNIQAGTPMENLAALFEAFREFRGPLR